MKVAIIQFPGSNCDWDAEHSVNDVIGLPAGRVWHKDPLPDGVEAVIVPGGFSFGDYLRCGAIARFSPIMADLKQFADQGGQVLGICNGFQILKTLGCRISEVCIHCFGTTHFFDSFDNSLPLDHMMESLITAPRVDNSIL